MNTLKVKWIKNGAAIGFAYFKDDESFLEEKTATELHAAGMVMIIENEITLPEDVPSRQLLMESGFSTVEGLASMTVEELTEIKGIGKKSAEKIYEYFQNPVK